ncbi:MAG: class IV adenylate cyclase [Acidobacteriota bacterium]
MPIETEIKLRVAPDPKPVLERIQRLGYLAQGPRQLEVDQLFDRPTGELRGGGQVLRLRTRGDRSTLTYKGPAERQPHKSREEIELDLSDGAAFTMVLAALGYQPTFRYEKYRTTFVQPNEPGIITLDETPIGAFLELEGPAIWIDRTALDLGYQKADYITGSYASLYRGFRAENPTVPLDMVFQYHP